MSNELKPKEFIEKNTDLVKKIREVAEQILIVNRDQILSFKNEKQFLDYMASVADDMIQLNAIAETIDELIAKIAFKYLDKLVLDKFLGDDWFIKLQTWLKNIEIKVAG